MERRTLRRDKQELVELQQNIQSEIKAKEQIMKELTQVRSQLADTERYYVTHRCSSTYSLD